MNSRPKLQRSPLALPSYPGHNDALWGTLLELANAQLPEWTLIGGQMVLLHALENGAEPTRFSQDIDVVVNARVGAFAATSDLGVLAPRGETFAF